MKQKTPGIPGRPREFDRDAALETAMKLFCKHGYEGVSIADLTAAMHIAPPSLYAAFGGKDALYREALALYMKRANLPQTEYDGPVRELVRKMLYDTAQAATDPEFPAGCMVAAGMLNCGAEHEALADEVADIRAARLRELYALLKQAVVRGDLPVGTDTMALARHVMALTQGIAIQARDGATTAELQALVDVALANWPGTAP